jgi:hypothetical protein
VTYGGGIFVAVAGSATGPGNRVMTSPDGVTWTTRASTADNYWTSVTYGGGLFVAVSGDTPGNRVMTSPDGVTWTLRASAADNDWRSVTYGGGLFVAVAGTGSGNRVMTSDLVDLSNLAGALNSSSLTALLTNDSSVGAAIANNETFITEASGRLGTSPETSASLDKIRVALIIIGVAAVLTAIALFVFAVRKNS